jgi:hypothetical protein
MVEDSIFEVPGITSKEFINETYGKTQGLIGGSMGANFPVHKLWNIMLEASSHFTFSSGISGNAKVSLKSNIGLFLGLGLEYDYIWAVYQPIRISSNDDAIDEEISARLKVLTGEIKAHDSDYPNFHTHQIYGLGSIGYHINLKNNWALQFEVQGLINPGYTTGDNIILLSRNEGIDSDPPVAVGTGDRPVPSRFQYGLHGKVRAMITIIKFFK